MAKRRWKPREVRRALMKLEMEMKTAFVFPGQGSQAVGMGKDLYEYFREQVEPFYQRAQDALGFDLKELIFSGPEEKLQLTQYAQPAILLDSAIKFHLLSLRPGFGAGHSLGEYSALVCAGVLSLEDALILVHKRGRYMQEAVPVGTGAMVAVMKLDYAKVEQICTATGAEIANFNSPQQIVISGRRESVLQAKRLAEAAGGAAIELKVSAPFHCSLMKPAEERLKRASFLKIDGQFFIEGVEKLDERTVRIRFRVPMPSLFLDGLAQLFILPKHKLEGKDLRNAWGVGEKPEEFAGLGPFKVAELKRDRIVFVRNEFYWKVDQASRRLPYLDRIIWQVAKEEELLKLFQSGQIDILTPRDPSGLPTSARLIVGGPIERVNYLALNQDVPDPEKQALFRDVRFRRALAHASDRAALAKREVGGFGVVREGFIHPLSRYADEAALVKYPYDLGRAAALLDELGLKDTNGDGIRQLPSGKELRLELLLSDRPVVVAQGKLYQEKLGRIGIKVELEVVSSEEFGRRLLNVRPPRYEAALASTFINMRVPFMISDLAKLFKSDGSLHFYRYSDAKAKELPEAQRRIDEILRGLITSTSAEALFSKL